MPLSCAPWDPLEGIPPENRPAKAIEVVGRWMNGELDYLPESVKKAIHEIDYLSDSVKKELLGIPSSQGLDEWAGERFAPQAPEDAVVDPVSGAKLSDVLGGSEWKYDSATGLLRLEGTPWTYDPKDQTFRNHGNAGGLTPSGYVTGMKYPGDPL